MMLMDEAGRRDGTGELLFYFPETSFIAADIDELIDEVEALEAAGIPYRVSSLHYPGHRSLRLEILVSGSLPS